MPDKRKQNYTRREVIGTLGAAVVGTSTAAFPTNVGAKEKESTQAVTTWRVTRYRFGWNAARRTGIVQLYLQNVTNPITINVASPEELSGYITVLKGEQVFYNSAGWVHTGSEPIT